MSRTFERPPQAGPAGDPRRGPRGAPSSRCRHPSAWAWLAGAVLVGVVMASAVHTGVQERAARERATTPRSAGTPVPWTEIRLLRSGPRCASTGNGVVVCRVERAGAGPARR